MGRIEKEVYTRYRDIFNSVVKEANRKRNGEFINKTRNKTTAVWILVKKVNRQIVSKTSFYPDDLEVEGMNG